LIGSVWKILVPWVSCAVSRLADLIRLQKAMMAVKFGPLHIQILPINPSDMERAFYCETI
jgi:hypothetical protein